MDTITSYSNDDHLDKAYELVFNRFTLSARLHLRLVCQRWKAIIEADTSQMTTLRVFGKNEDLWDYIWRNKHSPIKPPTAEEELKFDPNGWNTIILKRPGEELNHSDLSFLARLFPSVQNLVLTWDFGKSRAKPKLVQPDIFSLLTAWAPNLRVLYLSTSSFEYARNYSKVSDDTSLSNAKAFWDCLTLMAPTLTKLALNGIDISNAPESLLLPSLVEMTHNFIRNMKTTRVYLTPPFFSSDRLNKLAPTLQSIRLCFPVSLGSRTEYDTFWSWSSPPTVSRLSIQAREICERTSSETIIPCPSITHLEIDLNEYAYPDVIAELLRKFPCTKFLAISEEDAFLHWLIKYGIVFDAVGFLPSLARRSPGPFDGIEELYLASSFTGTIDNCNMYPQFEMENLDYDLMFRGIAAPFRGLKKLTLGIPPDTEEKHKTWLKIFLELKERYMPKVEMNFVLEMKYILREEAFVGGPQYDKSVAGQCFLTFGCAFHSHPEPTEKSNKKQRSK